MMKMQQSIQIRDRHCAKRNAGTTQQVNCKGDKIENIGQLLMHLGMDDIKNKCADCGPEIRQACLDKQLQTVSIKQIKITQEQTSTDSQCIETKLLKRRGSSDKKRAVESKFILSSIFASLCVVVITFH